MVAILNKKLERQHWNNNNGRWCIPATLNVLFVTTLVITKDNFFLAATQLLMECIRVGEKAENELRGGVGDRPISRV